MLDVIVDVVKTTSYKVISHSPARVPLLAYIPTLTGFHSVWHSVDLLTVSMPAFAKTDPSASRTSEDMKRRKRTREDDLEENGPGTDDEFLKKFQEEYQARRKQKKVKQRTAANARERKRVGRINSAFVLLEAKLQDSQITQEQCLSKIKTLRYAIEYIQSLKKILQEADSISQIDSPCDSPHSFAAESVASLGDPPTCQYESSDDRSLRGDTLSDSCSDIFSSLSVYPMGLAHSLTDLTAPSLRQIWPECVGLFPCDRDHSVVRSMQSSHIQSYRDPGVLTSPFGYHNYQPGIHYC